MEIAIFTVFGLQFGSFLNVVIYRLPRMLQQQWRKACSEFLNQPHDETSDHISLTRPHSACMHCGTRLRIRDLVPVFSFLALKGSCAHCGKRISWRYPLVELAVAVAWGLCAARWGWTWTALAWAGFATTLMALALIDLDTMLLPDSLTLPLMWMGLVCSALHLTNCTLDVALWGAIAGYMSLWLVASIFEYLTHKQGMGEGDFKLLAALGAWLGWTELPSLLLIASSLAIAAAIVMHFYQARSIRREQPFGPMLVFAGFTLVLLFN